MSHILQLAGHNHNNKIWVRLALNHISFLFCRYSDTVCDEGAFKAISFESIFTAFIVLAFGIGVAVLSVILEKFWNKPEKNKRNPGRDIGKFAIKKGLNLYIYYNLG